MSLRVRISKVVSDASSGFHDLLGDTGAADLAPGVFLRLSAEDVAVLWQGIDCHSTSQVQVSVLYVRMHLVYALYLLRI